MKRGAKMKTVGKYFYVTISVLLFISLSVAAQGRSLQDQLSQLESDLQKRERAERIWREAVNSRDVVFLPMPMSGVGDMPVFIDKETFAQLVLMEAASKRLSEEKTDWLLTQIEAFDKALREQMRKRYLPWLVDQIKMDRDQIAMIRAEMGRESQSNAAGVDIGGTWDGWGTVVLWRTEPNTFEGTYTDTYGPAKGGADEGTIKVTFNPAAGRYEGTWSEAPPFRTGTLYFTVSQDEQKTVTGKHSADATCTMQPGWPKDALLRWTWRSSSIEKR